MKKIFILGLMISVLSVYKLKAQDAITTATPFLLISTDARAGGMADMGVATSSDAYSIFHNPSKIAFNKNKISIGVNYAPWLRNLTNDIFVGNFSIVNRINETSAWGVDFKYFSLGKIEKTSDLAKSLGYVNPSELSLTGVYSMKLSETFSMGVGLKYINSNLDVSQNSMSINSFAVDVSGLYRSTEENYGTFNGRYRLGFNITNVGPKVEYTPGVKHFIPANLKLGGSFDFILDDFNTITATLETTKLLVPTPVKDGSHKDKGWIGGMFSSFGDAPGGFSEEMKEFTWALGGEYKYNNAFAVRTGYYHESEEKGNRQFFTLGAGFKARAVVIDLSYLMNTSNVNNPLENTLRFSLGVDLGEIFED